jgi:hypothetical protein
MVSIEVSRIRQRRPLPRNQVYNCLPTFLALLAVVSWTSVLIAWLQSTISTDKVNGMVTDDHHHQHGDSQTFAKQDGSRNHEGTIGKDSIPQFDDIDIFPDNLQHEAFWATLKSCLPLEQPSKCRKYIPPETGIERIGIIRPPGSIGYVLDTFIQEVIRMYPPISSRTLEVISTSHVPPYGYGKTHGYTRLIRLATMPLLLAASNLVLDHVMEGRIGASTEMAITLTDITQALRQIVRWHCRLSHVAAHTAILTIPLEDLLENPWEMEYQVRVFLDLFDGTHKNHTLEDHLDLEKQQHVDVDELEGSMDDIVHKSMLLLMRLDQERYHTTGNLRTDIPKLEDYMNSIIQEELDSTQQLTAWPCKSFWDFGTIGPTDCSKHTAELFSPNCTIGNCWVPRDLCEVHGDVLCPKQKK